VFAELFRVVPDLDDELARGRHDEASGAPPRPGPRVPQEVGENGDEKCGRLSGAGLGLTGDVPAGQGNRERFCLDRRGIDEAGLGDALANFRREVVAREFNSGEVVPGSAEVIDTKSLSEPGTARPQSSTSGFLSPATGAIPMSLCPFGPARHRSRRSATVAARRLTAQSTREPAAGKSRASSAKFVERNARTRVFLNVAVSIVTSSAPTAIVSSAKARAERPTRARGVATATASVRLTRIPRGRRSCPSSPDSQTCARCAVP
jgi:hypothetical protein